MSQTAQFAIGQIIHHKLFGYDGVIFEVDPYFMLSDDWYRRMARSKPRKDAPWYHVLVNNSIHTTYVAQQNLQACNEVDCINHPKIMSLFAGMEAGRYRLKKLQLQ